MNGSAFVLQAKVKEPELYELHDRVKQIRSEMNESEKSSVSAQQHALQHGIATQ